MKSAPASTHSAALERHEPRIPMEAPTFSGSWEDISIYQTHDGLDKYTIKTTKLFSICSSCLNEELYNEQKDEYYCPSCLEHRPWNYRLSKLYRRVKSYLPEKVKQ